jgi:thiamine-phosphate pyrophosphorylase
MREALHTARLYLVCDASFLPRLEDALAGGVDLVQLRDKRRALPSCRAHGVPLIVNDRPHVAAAAGADGVHVGQDDLSPARARAIVGPQAIVGLSTHTPADIDRANEAGVDYIGVGPVNATPTKPGRPAVGEALVAYAARHARMPFFAIGGIDAGQVARVRAAGARGVAVVRAITQAQDPRAASRALREALEREPAKAVAAR